MTNVLFPETIKIVRPYTPTGVGTVGYGGAVQSQEKLIVKDIPANIHMATSGRVNATSGVPSDSPEMKWTITLPAAVMQTMPLIMERDVIYDGKGRRFQVAGYEPYTLGGTIDTIRMLG